MPTGSDRRPPGGKRRLTTDRARTGLKQERAVRTRGQVLDAAAQAFAAKGFPGVTILEVAERTGMTKGAVYFHYPSKEALAIAVAEEFYDRLPAIAATVRERALPPLESVAELLTSTAVAFRDDTVIQAGARLQIERSLIGASLPMPYVGYTETVTAWLQEASDADELTAADPGLVARVLISAFFGAQHLSWVLNDRVDIAERVNEIVGVVLGVPRPG
ncbi:ScbR family autoregulator-binding transcription factor [Streptomyces sp. NBC_01190]|uniref:ScbR family autoregulator-binding transcription factor n=1 Tax=Streptomyces sp. NBC_01190 TaxID=2903767 RepID=UPI003868F9B0|nr:TetR/AcrR family transcriptional regulator [Streptomyces sp. NBC_01190]